METNTKPVTILDVLIDVNVKLRDIKIPVSELESIGYPIAGAVNGIQVCIDALMKNENRQAEPQPEPAPEEEENGEENA